MMLPLYGPSLVFQFPLPKYLLWESGCDSLRLKQVALSFSLLGHVMCPKRLQTGSGGRTSSGFQWKWEQVPAKNVLAPPKKI